jgi:carbon-monoxide dehydrogenase medium subunit
MIPAAFDYLAPRTVDEALSALADHGEEAKVLAGGQSLLPLMKLRLANPKLLIDLAKIPALSGITRHEGRLVIGALTTHYQIESSELLKRSCPLLPQIARAIGDVQVRNRGTIGGSIAHADPAADWPAALLALRGEFTVRGRNGDRVLNAEEFFLGPMTTALEPAEILIDVRVPAAPRRWAGAYQKMAQQASGFAIVGVAVSLTTDGAGKCADIGIGVTGLSDKPFRADSVGERLRGEKLTAKLIEASAAHAADGIEPLEDLHANAEFRAHLARVYTARALQQAANLAGRSR